MIFFNVVQASNNKNKYEKIPLTSRHMFKFSLNIYHVFFSLKSVKLSSVSTVDHCTMWSKWLIAHNTVRMQHSDQVLSDKQNHLGEVNLFVVVVEMFPINQFCDYETPDFSKSS